MGRLIDADKLSPDCMYNKNGTRGFAISQSQIANAPTVDAIPRADYEALKQHLFELSYSIDSHSSSKDYAALRNTHYENQNWIKENGLQDEYYNYFFKQIKEIQNDTKICEKTN